MQRLRKWGIVLIVVIASIGIGLGIATNLKQNHELDHSNITIGVLSNDVAGLRAQIYSLGQTPTAPPPEIRTEGQITTVVGPQGDKGLDGSPGPAGRDGSTPSCYFLPSQCAGSQGPQGPAGAQGASGEVGPAGPQGAAGANGVDGRDGTNGTNGNDGQNGTNGTDGVQGPQGPQGIPGPLATNYTITHWDGTSEACQLQTGSSSAYTCTLLPVPAP